MHFRVTMVQNIISFGLYIFIDYRQASLITKFHPLKWVYYFKMNTPFSLKCYWLGVHRKVATRESTHMLPPKSLMEPFPFTEIISNAHVLTINDAPLRTQGTASIILRHVWVLIWFGICRPLYIRSFGNVYILQTFLKQSIKNQMRHISYIYIYISIFKYHWLLKLKGLSKTT